MSLTDNQITALHDLYRAYGRDQGERIRLHYRTHDALQALGAIDRAGEITATGMATFEAYAHGMRAVIRLFDTDKTVHWDDVRRDAMTGVRDMTECAVLGVALDRLIRAHEAGGGPGAARAP